jgi:hypothetical protein
MKEPARLIIPLWGEAYANKLVSITLPALLAPGNLPTFCTQFDVELVVVTETRLFAYIEAAPSFQRAAKLCRCRFASLDDLMTDTPGDYGVTLTYSLFRGFTDLGPRMTQTWLLFFNADFIVSDGALRHVGALIRQGKQVIHAPSFRVVLEDVWPQLETRVDAASSVLAFAPRDMVRLALDHKHATVQARTVNQRLCHQNWMDQFYWYVDDDTLIGYQFPVALVAIKPERCITEPVQVWDFGFIPEASPTAERHFIGDSDDFFMLEPQKRKTGEELIRMGWLSVDDIARDLSKYTTKEQREAGSQLLTIHARDLPPNIGDVIAQSRAFMAEVVKRLSPVPQPHVGHGQLAVWFEAAKERMKARRTRPAPAERGPEAGPSWPPPADAVVVTGGGLPRRALAMLRAVYRASFGSPPDVGPFHPLWLDTRLVADRVTEWKRQGASILWLTSGDSLFHRMLHDRRDPAVLFLDQASSSVFADAPYDACLCEVTIDELATLNRLYGRIRPLMRNGAEVLFLVSGSSGRWLSASDATLQSAFPDVDVSDVGFFGSGATDALRRLYLRTSKTLPDRPLLRAIATGAVLIGLAPLVRIANALAAKRDPSIFTPRWSSAVIRFQVTKKPLRQETPARRPLVANSTMV